MSEYLAQVVKNVASQNLEIRKIVYIYLLRYAEQEPDLALLSINTFQKDLADSNPLNRAMALRVLSGIRVPMIGSIVVLAIKNAWQIRALTFARQQCWLFQNVMSEWSACMPHLHLPNGMTQIGIISSPCANSNHHHSP